MQGGEGATTFGGLRRDATERAPAVDRVPVDLAPGLLARHGVAETADGYVIEWHGWVRRFLSGGWFAVAVMAIYAGLFVGMVGSSPYWSPFATVDEQVTYYQVARNFNRYGFLRTFFLHDVSTASDPALHPFVYNHMPPGPEIFTALLMKAAGENYALIRLVFGLIFFAGLLCYLRFARLVLGRIGLAGAGFSLLFLTPYSMMHAVDHPAYSPFALLAFLPLLLLDRHYETGRRWLLALALSVVFVSSVYLVYQNLVMLGVSWILLAWFRIVRFDRRHLVLFLGAAVLGVVLHALQSVLLFGPAFFFKETLLALSNRMLGVPTFQDLKEFYRSVDLVHHGGHRLDLLGLGAAILATLRLSEPTLTPSIRLGETSVTVILMLLVLVWSAGRLGRWDWEHGRLTIPRGSESEALLAAVQFLVAISVWAGAAIAAPMLLFPAYSVDYGLSGMSEFFLAIALVAMYAYMLSCWLRWRPRLGSGSGLGPATLASLVPGAVALALLAGIAWGLYGSATLWHYRLWTSYLQVPESNPEPDELIELGRTLGGKVVMTNVYPTTVGFFTGEAAFGGCERPVFRADGGIDPAQCHVAFVPGFGRGPTAAPTHYVLFRKRHLTGFTRCRDRCMDEFHGFVSARYPTVFANDLFTVFDVTRPKGTIPAPGGTS